MHLLKNFKPQAIVFDKDGTLIDFDLMWGSWTLQLADRLQAAIGLDFRQALSECYGYDMRRRKILADGKLTCTPMWRLRELMVEVVASFGVPAADASCAVAKAWHVPDPVTLAKPLQISINSSRTSTNSGSRSPLRRAMTGSLPRRCSVHSA